MIKKMVYKKFYHEPTCKGCSKATGSVVRPNYHRCSVFMFVPSAYERAELCPFNLPVVETKKAKTKGQQKQGRNR